MLRITPLAIRPGESLGLPESETATVEVGSPAREVGFHGHIILPPPCKDGRQKQGRDQAAIAKAAERETDPAAIWTHGPRANFRSVGCCYGPREGPPRYVVVGRRGGGTGRRRSLVRT